ncbi:MULTISPECIES: hypothetical protein [unclassified Breznakia]|uniref:hypothetical protein n=1 Tax=unclassified Breznakia TaxID=2623764 RepID=UPI002474CE9B|nr:MULTISPECIES: hypothetical protein [unclassified Breznakia]MDH6367065.1 hypothetical protein [Breznakia sp. PH1-1]MDH6404163.1 hypothetical protein [Breznakia sp. PF1-11]MDH6411952.1 hypothetical protein [Breznakia sp. PFB1-11]MDH6414151.1 hypothetical protein [Breznakia sp. PFB1-14]MDH6418904.1 hypothetical protein [Breznakia sp. PFB1-12]
MSEILKMISSNSKWLALLFSCIAILVSWKSYKIGKKNMELNKYNYPFIFENTYDIDIENDVFIINFEKKQGGLKSLFIANIDNHSEEIDYQKIQNINEKKKVIKVKINKVIKDSIINFHDSKQKQKQKQAIYDTKQFCLVMVDTTNTVHMSYFIVLPEANFKDFRYELHLTESDTKKEVDSITRNVDNILPAQILEIDCTLFNEASISNSIEELNYKAEYNLFKKPQNSKHIKNSSPVLYFDYFKPKAKKVVNALNNINNEVRSKRR